MAAGAMLKVLTAILAILIVLKNQEGVLEMIGIPNCRVSGQL